MRTNFIAVTKLKAGAYYEGHCRNASIARWNGRVFVYWRYKLGERFLEEINAPENDSVYDVFYAEKEMDINTIARDIPIESRE